MKELQKGDFITKEHLRYLNHSNTNSLAHRTEKNPTTSNYSVVEIKDKKYLVTRVGDCQYKQCKNACCKVVSEYCGGRYNDGEKASNYISGFADRILFNKHAIINKKCSHLCSRSGKCTKWGKKSFPGPCYEFPHIWDGVYAAVIDKCTFKFKVVEVIQ